MKYMGSKRAMLSNGLGTLLEHEIPSSRRFVDLFTGSAAVASHVAQKYEIPVLAIDLQLYSVALAAATLRQRKPFHWKRVWNSWHKRAVREVNRVGRIPSVPRLLTKQVVARHRRWCERRENFPLTMAYGGHYFSARQMIWIESLRRTLPRSGGARRAALAALIQAASQCVASPGHTAQPFQPTLSARRFLKEAWLRDVQKNIQDNLIHFSMQTAKRKGAAKKQDANIVAKELRKTDLVFIDPPYSGVHYSRFYHVLESVAKNRCGQVSGTGRYPPSKHRPWSRYSVQSESQEALDQLLATIAKRGSKAILTFPDHACSNGLSGSAVKKIAAKHFDVRTKSIGSRFSTLGGTGDRQRNSASRDARHYARELVLTLYPRG